MKAFIVFCFPVVAVAYSQYFCPEPGQPLDCLDVPRTATTAYCLSDGTWVCGKCAVKARSCSDGVMVSRHENTCTNSGNPKPSC